MIGKFITDITMWLVNTFENISMGLYESKGGGMEGMFHAGLMLFLGFSIITFSFRILKGVVNVKKDQQIGRKIKTLGDNAVEMSPAEFQKIQSLKSKDKGKKLYSNKYSFSGVYLLKNITKNKYYVGQSKNVFARVQKHFTGSGNGDVYADHKYGDIFTIRLITLENSGFDTLNSLERHAIKTYSGHATGYNRNRGNKG